MKISVIIPTLNAENEISGLLDAINKQQIKPDEILVIDSMSSDRTIEICETYPNVHIMQRQEIWR